MDFMKEPVEATRFDRSNELTGTMFETREKDELTQAIEKANFKGGQD